MACSTISVPLMSSKTMTRPKDDSLDHFRGSYPRLFALTAERQTSKVSIHVNAGLYDWTRSQSLGRPMRNSILGLYEQGLLTIKLMLPQHCPVICDEIRD